MVRHDVFLPIADTGTNVVTLPSSIMQVNAQEVTGKMVTLMNQSVILPSQISDDAIRQLDFDFLWNLDPKSAGRVKSELQANKDPQRLLDFLSGLQKAVGERKRFDGFTKSPGSYYIYECSDEHCNRIVIRAGSQEGYCSYHTSRVSQPWKRRKR
jgi:hypothetical protein